MVNPDKLTETELSNLDNKKLILKRINFHRYQIVTDIILILVIIAIGVYVYNNIEQLKTLGNDVCKLCMIKTNSTCIPNLIK